MRGNSIDFFRVSKRFLGGFDFFLKGISKDLVKDPNNPRGVPKELVSNWIEGLQLIPERFVRNRVRNWIDF